MVAWVYTRDLALIYSGFNSSPLVAGCFVSKNWINRKIDIWYRLQYIAFRKDDAYLFCCYDKIILLYIGKKI